jgi:regulatory protein
MTITALTSHPARKGRVRVYIDGEYAFELSKKVVQNHFVSEGEELEPARLRELQTIAAREAAIGLLARRERSRAELRTALKRKGIDDSIIAEVMGKIEKEGLQSDERFANAWVGTRRRLSPRGRAALAFELKQKGIGDTEAADALAKYKSGDEREAIRELIAVRVERFKGTKEDKEKFKHRLLAFLSRRGFAYDDIRSVLHRDFPQWS